ncbi:oxidoreductase, short chain dehydrogenase/reductase family protein [Aeromicrobium marinum DSM 15272]|uniref:Oxidoreductase, short chain dehydrogenase/reductase family protein n=1 Tax=Aeromicrobium marinum DSM 15272 TaxID=585531 RepID=E2SBJ3_9ACTN|nr:SDR family NAD(P)-dependent oxidoreductase [Aeromicrobium marinum]EFQ83739.1 oxidoreductase, short chain dehydrogenase/reductase family protein [Aeromicrobium marinum DSM 15272]
MGHFTNKVAVVTGAGSGIGRALALELARRGARVAISDVDVRGLDETEALVRGLGGDVRSDVLDVSQRELVMTYADSVVEHFGRVNLVINNAGIAYFGNTDETPFKDIERVMDVDFWGVVNGTKAFLPHLEASGDGHVVNISSIFGLFGVPSQGAYNAAKFAVRGFTEALAMEMRMSGKPVKVTCVHPGGIKTNIVRNSTAVQTRSEDLQRMSNLFDKHLTRTTAAKAAEVILDGVEKGKVRVLIGPDAKVLDLMVRAAGPRYQSLVRFFAGRTGL